MPFVYADFESIVPGGTVPMLALQANELRSAIIERGAAIGVDVSGTIPAEISSGDEIQLSWLTGMRTALEAVITGGKYGRFIWVSYNPVFTVWDKESLLTEVHAVHVPSWPDCGSGSDWISVSASDFPLASHIRELFYACEVLAYAKTTDPVESDRVEVHRNGSGSGATLEIAWNDAMANMSGWDGGWPNYPYAEYWQTWSDPNCYVEDDRLDDMVITPMGNVGVRELLIAGNFYSNNGGWGGAVRPVHLYLGANQATEVDQWWFLNSDGSGFRLFAFDKFDFSGEPGGGLATDDTFHVSMKGWMENVGGDWGYVDVIAWFCGYDVGLLSYYPNYIARYNFDRSKFLWTLPPNPA